MTAGSDCAGGPLRSASEEESFLALPEPADFRIALPDNWAVLRTDAGPLERQVTELVRRRARRNPALGTHLAAVTAALLHLATDARAAGGVLVALMSEVISQPGDGLVLSASLVVSSASSVTDAAGCPARDVAAALRSPERHVDVVELAQCPAVRVTSIDVVPSPSGDAEASALLVQYHVAVPGADRRTILSFSTPVLPLAAEMAELFDLVASSFSYVWPGPQDAAPG